MASLLGIFSTLLIISMVATTSSVEATRQFTVGDDLGWQQPDPNNTAFYSQWAERNRFQIGDSLAFEYQNDSVLTVEKWDYYHCDASDPITAFDNGKSTINLDRPGPFYFISGTHDHCINGQRLIVDVMSPHPIPASPPSIFSAPPPDQAASQSEAGPSPSSLISSGVSPSLDLRSDFKAVLVIFGVMLLLTS